MVTWDEIPGLDQNGIIINYDVQIESLDFSTEILIITSNLFTHIGFSGLEVFNIRVRAHTSVGPGPYSDPVTERTFENGMYSSLSFLCGIIYIQVFLQNRQHLLKTSKQKPFLPLQSW